MTGRGLNFNNFPSFTNIAGKSGFTNVMGHDRIDGKGTGLTVRKQKKNKAIMKYDCYQYPRISLAEVKNEGQRIKLINSILPTTGDMVWGISEDYLKQTHYQYNGFTAQQINQILGYEYEIGMVYLLAILSNANRSRAIIDKLIEYFSGDIISSMITNTQGNITEVKIRNNHVLKVELFLRMCKELKLIEKYLDKELRGKERNWNNFIKKYKFNQAFIEQLSEINIQLLSCFSLEETKKKFKFLGICKLRQHIDNPNTISFIRLTVQYYGEVLTYLLNPNVRKNSKSHSYWIRRGINPIRLAILDSFIYIESIEKMIKVDLNTPPEDVLVNDIDIVRGDFIGEIKDSKYMPSYTKTLHYKMQGFPHKNITYRNITQEDIYNMIHTKQEKRLFYVENISLT